ncbi:Pimeloyl-ACP methyl ester carboxylesterase [Streptomyces sp. 2224.1]|uniref:alpha/beta fold hydrolase n=1 Tax=unclassified Streptomyces TaxID=2593676 RepID=UPI0008951C25|nr:MULTISPECIES: alpha/beta hydrolase [unclassified Streptomyces]SED50753.1 Pimeloyl-ACP methyl ester carboxylesterase [Streptomyces sp. 2224.1]SEF17771.1 Pimeloyl-ACP methyl ester carboxylesterase [Streptomyces sp. 2112.3]
MNVWTPTRWARNDEVELAYDELTGSQGKAPLLLVTGLGVSRLWWPDGLAQALAAQGFAVARYDQRDAGESTHLPPTATGNPITALFRKRGASYTAQDMTDDAIAVMDALGWESAHLFGQSLGGAVAQRIALRHPGRVRTLTSVSAVPGDAAGLGALRYIRLRTLGKLARMTYPDTPEGDIEAGIALARLLHSPAHPLDEQAVRDAVTSLADSGVRDGHSQSRQIGAPWHGPAINRITVPTLVLHGADDPLVKPAAGRAVAARIPGARFVSLPGVGHDLPEPVWNDVAMRVRRLADR